MLIPNLHHYDGNGDRAIPLFRVSKLNLRPAFLAQRYGQPVNGEDVMAYLVAFAANPAFATPFQPEAVQLGRRVIWLHTYGERFSAPTDGSPKGPPRLPKAIAPRIPAEGAISDSPGAMPETIAYDAAEQRLLVGNGYVEHVTPAVWNYEVSDKQVLRQWFSYRQKDRGRPVMGDRRPPSKLEEVQADHWLAEHTTDLIDLLNVLGLLVELEPQQADLLERLCAGPMISLGELNEAQALDLPPARVPKKKRNGEQSLFDIH